MAMNTFVPRVQSVPQQKKPRGPPAVLIACTFTYYANARNFLRITAKSRALYSARENVAENC